jgi:hypothetical protein
MPVNDVTIYETRIVCSVEKTKEEVGTREGRT